MNGEFVGGCDIMIQMHQDGWFAVCANTTTSNARLAQFPTTPASPCPGSLVKALHDIGIESTFDANGEEES